MRLNIGYAIPGEVKRQSGITGSNIWQGLMTMQKHFARLGQAVGISLAMIGTAAANHTCRNVGTFEQCLAAFKREAINSGISQTTVSRALDGVTYDPGV